MISIKNYISEDNISFYLCRMRAKLAKRRNKSHLVHLLSTNPKFNYHSKELSSIDKELTYLIPKRSSWKNLGNNSRTQNGKPLNSVDKNIKSLLFTINYFKKELPDEPVTKNHNNFIRSILSSIFYASYSIGKPDIYPKPKDDSTDSPKICRPISIFNLKDKIIICLINKFLTDLFDKYFYSHSYAFRSPINKDGIKKAPTHHDTIQSIITYLAQHQDENLWIAECDMMKFYDTVNHYVVKRKFNDLIKRAKKDNPGINIEPAKRIFYSYLDCYAFNKDVYTKNKDQSFFQKHYIGYGEFEWVENDLKRLAYYKAPEKERIGVPQGGALSGLIANIVLNYVDQEILRLADDNLLYIRYCDDMLIIHPDKEVCLKAYKKYLYSLRDLKLIPHPSYKMSTYSKDYWSAKSRAPYLWSSTNSTASPWISFVGYEINRQGDIRVRKKSLKKEMKKQYETINQIRQAIKSNNKRARNRTIEESAINKLIGSSVGRVKIWNYQTIQNEMCWVKGFSELNDNKYSRVQIKRLDACRNKLIRKLKHDLSKSPEVEVKESRRKRKQIVYYGKPFSYYYHTFEK
jgi:hypothetical protein